MYAKTSAVGPENGYQVYIGQADFENDCTSMDKLCACLLMVFNYHRGVGFL